MFGSKLVFVRLLLSGLSFSPRGLFFIIFICLQYRQVSCDRWSSYRSSLFGHAGHGNRRIARDIRALKNSFNYNRMLLDNIKQSYEVLYPQQIEKGRTSPINTSRHKIRHHGTHEHVEQLTVQVVIEGRKFKLKLTRNKVLLSSGIVVKHFEKDNQQVLTKTIEHCYYHGHVKREEWSSVAVSTCNGIRGVIQMRNKTYVIQPLIKEPNIKEHAHVIFQSSASPKENCGNDHGLWLPFQELHKRELIKRIKFLNAEKMHHGGPDKKERKLLRIAMVLDKSMYMGLEFSQQDVIHYAVDVANIVDLYFRQLHFDVALTYLEFWNLFDRFKVEKSHRSLLNKFLHFKENKLPNDSSFDAAFFVTGVELKNHKAGIAIPDSVCSNRAVGIVKSGLPFEPQQTATILSHMAGHVLGIEHDEDGDCVCKDPFGCIMSSEMLSAQKYHSRMFSTCSESDVEVSLDMGIASCLSQTVEKGEEKGEEEFKQTCGNNIVERGEECDCGSAQECLKKDPCCDPSTCLLQSWAQCRSGPCCNNCTFLSSSQMCQPRQSECDIPEFCNGQSGECPFNKYVEDGHPCANGTGYCLGGICPSFQAQCKGIWGKDAKGGHMKCFERFNPTGNFNGHCGKDKLTGSYAKCQHHDISCGLLHCEGGLLSPLYGTDEGFSSTQINANGIQYECKTVHGPAMMDMPHMGMVQDGTKCGRNKICVRNSCENLPVVPRLDCPSTDLALICSGHGVCASDDSCFCDGGWENFDCSIRSNVTLEVGLKDGNADKSLASSSMAPTTTIVVEAVPISNIVGRDGLPLSDRESPLTAPIEEEGGGISTTLLIIILATVVGALVLAMGVTLICYRRRSPVKTIKVMKDNGKGSSKERNKKFWGKKKKWLSSEEESEMSELPPPPIIVMDPDSAKPEKGILKNSSARLAAMDYRDSQDRDSSVGPYLYDEDEDIEAEEICNIFKEDSADNLDHLQESRSFDFVIPPPPPLPQFPLPEYYPTSATYMQPSGNGDYARMLGHEYESPSSLRHEPLHVLPQQTNPLWRTALPPQTLSPPQSRIVKLRNLNDYMNKMAIDLSPSPDDPPTQQLSPSTCTSEDVRSSETETDRFQRTSHSDHSPTSVTSGSTQHRPSYGNLSQYILKRGEAAASMSSNGDGNDTDRAERDSNNSGSTLSTLDRYFSQHNNLNAEFLPKMSSSGRQSVDPSSITMPPPMNPINIRNFLCMGHAAPGSVASRDSNSTPQGSVNGDNSSFTTGTGNSKSGGYDKSSGYGSEQDHERLSAEDVSRSDSQHSRSESLSRSQSSSPPSYSAVIRTGPNRIQLIPASQLVENGQEIEGIQQELNKLLENLPRIHAGSFERSPLQSSATPSTPLTGPLPANRLLKEDSLDNNAPCIDRSLEEIPAHFTDKRKRNGSHRGSKNKRPISVAVQSKPSSSNSSLDEVQSLVDDEIVA